MQYVFVNCMHWKCSGRTHTKYKQWLPLGKRIKLMGIRRGGSCKEDFHFYSIYLYII